MPALRAVWIGKLAALHDGRDGAPAVPVVPGRPTPRLDASLRRLVAFARERGVSPLEMIEAAFDWAAIARRRLGRDGRGRKSKWKMMPAMLAGDWGLRLLARHRDARARSGRAASPRAFAETRLGGRGNPATDPMAVVLADSRRLRRAVTSLAAAFQLSGRAVPPTRDLVEFGMVALSPLARRLVGDDVKVDAALRAAILADTARARQVASLYAVMGLFDGTEGALAELRRVAQEKTGRRRFT